MAEQLLLKLSVNCKMNFNNWI